MESHLEENEGERVMANDNGKPTLTREGMGIVTGLPLEIADDSPGALRDAVQLLLDMEAIRRVKHTYFRCIDTGNFEELAGLFHQDVKVLSLIHI